MQLLKQTKPQCLLYAAAMVLDEDPENLITELGHDGLTIFWPEREGNAKYIGFHIQEIISLFLKRGLALTPIEVMPVSAPAGEGSRYHYPYETIAAITRFEKLIANRWGIIIGDGHAYAWDGKVVYDPNGAIRDLNDITVRECWIVVELGFQSSKP